MQKVIFLSFLFCAISNLLPAQVVKNRLLSEEYASGVPLLPAGGLFADGEPGLYGAGIEDLLNQAFDSVCNLSPIKGISAAVLLPDGAVWKRAYGTAGLGLPLSSDHLLAMGSISKSFIAATLLSMQEDGLISLDDPIGDYVGPYPNIDGSATIRQVLGHRSGYNDYLNENPSMGQAWLNNMDSLWVVDTILNHYVLAPNFAVDEGFSYSNTNYLIAGRVIEAVTGQPWHVAVRSRILTPLGLTHTFAFPFESTGNQDLAHVFIDLDGNGSVEDFQAFGFPLEGLFSMASSAGCLVTTPEDLVRFSEQVHGGYLLQDSSLQQMHTDLDGDPNNFFAYGLGASSFSLPTANWGHDGSIIYNSLAVYLPEIDVAIAVQQNDDRTSAPQAPLTDFISVFLSLFETCLNNPLSATREAPEAGSFIIWPNPVQDALQIRFDDLSLQANFPAPFTVSDASGRTILQAEWQEGRQQLYLPELPKGMYYLKIGQFVQKFVKI